MIQTQPHSQQVIFARLSTRWKPPRGNPHQWCQFCGEPLKAGEPVLVAASWCMEEQPGPPVYGNPTEFIGLVRAHEHCAKRNTAPTVEPAVYRALFPVVDA